MDADPSPLSTAAQTPEIRARISDAGAEWNGNGHLGREDARAVVAPLVEEARRGDRDAFGELYRRYHRQVFGLVRFYLGATAEDAVAETFVRAWAGLPRYRSSGAPFVGWLYGIARHVVTDELRSNGRSESRAEVPEQAVESDHDGRLALEGAIAKLPQHQRRIIEMKYLMGMRNPEVAAVLKKSIGAVNAQQWRALQALKRMLDSE